MVTCQSVCDHFEIVKQATGTADRNSTGTQYGDRNPREITEYGEQNP